MCPLFFMNDRSSFITTFLHVRYGDLVFAEFIYNFLYCGQKYFGAHMVIMSCRPSVKHETPYAHAMYVNENDM